MESSQTSVEELGRRVSEELKFAGRQRQSAVEEFGNMNKIFLREGAEARTPRILPLAAKQVKAKELPRVRPKVIRKTRMRW